MREGTAGDRGNRTKAERDPGEANLHVGQCIELRPITWARKPRVDGHARREDRWRRRADGRLPSAGA